MIGFAAAPAQASVIPSTCTYQTSFLNNVSRVSAYCTDTNTSPWDITIQCENPVGRLTWVNGWVSYGTGYSMGQCPIATSVNAFHVQDLNEP